MIPVTKPFLPPKEEVYQLLDEVWERNWLTNHGPLFKYLENDLKKYLQVPNVLYVTNGTVALQLAIKALGIEGEVITTPFSYVATTSSLVWENCTPVFADIDPHSFNIDPDKMEAAITERTTAILVTHVFGNPCDIEAIQDIAEKHDLKVIYDAAHCFGVKYKGHSIFNYGDVSATSFHATKLFHTVEGGAVFTANEQHNRRMELMANFGHNDFERFDGVGINGKNSEFHAAMGLVNLKYINQVLASRKEQHECYNTNLDFTGKTQQKIKEGTEWNYSYYPLVFKDENTVLKVQEALNRENIHPRRYFYPTLSSLDYVESPRMEMAENIAHRILCLPLYYELKASEIIKIARIINDNS